MAKFDKKMGMVAVGALAGGAGGYVAGTMIDKTDYASKDPDAAYKAKLAGAGVAAVAGAAALAYKRPILGTVLLVIGGGMAAEGYSAHEAYKASTAPPVVSVTPAGGGTPITLTGPSASTPAPGGLPVLIGAPGTSPMPSNLLLPANVKVTSPMQSAGAVLLQSGAAVRLGMAQSGAAVRLGM